jgi:S-adenosylmethionine synthetase
MSNTFMTSPKLMFTSESVSEGHPDKMCDQISDAVLDACLEQDPRSRVACETATKTGFVALLGEVTTKAVINFDDLVRRVVTEIGYDSSDKGFDGNSCGVLVAIAKQSGDIAMGVDHALETRDGHHLTNEEIESIGAGDQGMMFGFACNETPTLMPLPIYLAHKLMHRQSELRRNGSIPWLRPDAKSQVTIEYSHGKPVRVDTVLISTQHAPDVSQAEIAEIVTDQIIMPVLPEGMVDKDIKVYVNPTGSAGRVRHRCSASAFGQRGDLRHGKDFRRPHRGTHRRPLRPAPRRDHP